MKDKIPWPPQSSDPEKFHMPKYLRQFLAKPITGEDSAERINIRI